MIHHHPSGILRMVEAQKVVRDFRYAENVEFQIPKSDTSDKLTMKVDHLNISHPVLCCCSMFSSNCPFHKFTVGCYNIVCFL